MTTPTTSDLLSQMRRPLACAAVLAALLGGSARAADTVTLPGDTAFPESITSTADGTLYIGSVATGGVVRVSPGAAQAEPWIKPGAYGSRSTFGLLADEKSGTLWVCSNDVSGMGITGPTDTKGIWLKGFDLKTGEGKVSVAFPNPRSFCNDIAIGPDGAAYVTNTAAPEILRLPPGGSALEVWSTDPQLDPKPGEGGLDGLAFGPDGNLYVTTFTRAELFRVDVKDGKAGKVTKLTPSRPLVLADELRPYGGALLMIEGGGRLDRVTFSGDKAEIEVLKDGIAGGPTGVATVGDTAWVTVGQLSVIFSHDKAAKPDLPFRAIAVPLAPQ